MRLIENQQPIKALCTHGAYEPLRDAVRLWGTKRRANDLHPGASKELVNTVVGERMVSVANEEADGGQALRQALAWRPTIATGTIAQ